MEQKKTFAREFGELCGLVGGWFFSALCMWWGWNILAPHINCPMFGYWEVFAMRMMVSCVMKIFWQRKLDK